MPETITYADLTLTRETRPAVADPEALFGAERERPEPPAIDALDRFELDAMPDAALQDLIERTRGEYRRARRDADQGRRSPLFGAHREAAMLSWLLWEAFEREVQLAVTYYDNAWQHRHNASVAATPDRNATEAVAAHTHEGLCLEACKRAGAIRTALDLLR